MICRYAFSVPSPRHIWRIHRQTNVENFHAIARWLHSSAQVHTVRDIASAVAHRRLLIIYFSFSLIFRDAISLVCVCTLASRPPLVHSARAFNQGINASATFALTHNRKLTRNIYIYIYGMYCQVVFNNLQLFKHIPKCLCVHRKYARARDSRSHQQFWMQLR